MAIKKGMITGTACVIIPQHLQRLAEYIKYCLYISSIIVYTVNIHIASRDDIYNKFVIKVEAAFLSLPRTVKWQSFIVHDLKPYLNMDNDVKEVAIDHKLKKSQAKALQTVKTKALPQFKKIQASGCVKILNIQRSVMEHER